MNSTPEQGTAALKGNAAAVLREYVLITAGAVSMGAGVYFFKIPNGFATGGVSGIGTLLGKLAPIFTPSMWIMIINCVLYILYLFILFLSGILSIYL